MPLLYGEGLASFRRLQEEILKVSADLFETMIGAYYLEWGYEALLLWVQELYRPLIAVARRAYYDK